MKWNKSIITWLLLCLIVLLWWYYTYGLAEISDTLKNESQIYLIILMCILTFPIGFIWIYLLSLILYIAQDYICMQGTKIIDSIIFGWLGFLVLGYLQWFLIVPSIVKKRRMRKNTREK